MNRIEEAVVEVAGGLTAANLEYAIFGGAALMMHGSARSTEDVDLTVWLGTQSIESAVTTLTRRWPSRISNPVEFAERSRVLTVTLANGVAADIVFGALDFERDAIGRAETRQVLGETVRLIAPADLILHKAVSARARDQEDVTFLIRRFRNSLDREKLERTVRDTAASMGEPEVFERFQSAWR